MGEIRTAVTLAAPEEGAGRWKTATSCGAV